MIATKNFNPDTDRLLLCSCGHPDCDRRSVSQEHLNRVQVVRDVTGLPMIVTSGGRCPNHPDELHRTKPADHQNCNAVDVAVDGWTRGNVIAAAIDAGCNAIGVADTFVHLGFRDDLPEGHVTMWVY